MTGSIGASISAEAAAPNRRVLALCIGAGIWALVTLASAVQGQLFAAYHGRTQEWWPSLGYTAAVFSVWALLTPLVLKSARRIFSARPHRAVAAALWVLGYPVTTALHLLIFVLLFWPIYGTSFPTPLEMAQPVLLANLDKSVFAYAGLVAFAYLRQRTRERAKVEAPANTGRAGDGGLWIRAAGSSQLVRFDAIDWIAAAGDYAEVHSGDHSMLADSSLAALAEQLPENEFARIHRGAIVRLDRVREVRRLGRGDASLSLHSGKALRLSRRYREKLAAHIPL